VKTTRLVGAIIYLRQRRFLEKIRRLLPENTQVADFQRNNLRRIAINTAEIGVLARKAGVAVRANTIWPARIAISTRRKANFAHRNVLSASGDAISTT
jgi:hypothetical protein